MTNEEFVRQAYAKAEVKDLAAWVECFNPDGVFVDESVGCDLPRPERSRKAGRELRDGVLRYASGALRRLCDRRKW